MSGDTYLVVTARKGISSMQLAKEIGITQKSLARCPLDQLALSRGDVHPIPCRARRVPSRHPICWDNERSVSRK
jgi:hypothetical protein